MNWSNSGKSIKRSQAFEVDTNIHKKDRTDMSELRTRRFILGFWFLAIADRPEVGENHTSVFTLAMCGRGAYIY